MSTATSSARYTDLYDYCTAATQINDDLTGQGGRLSSRLSAFEATCREPGYRVGGDDLGGALQSYSTWAMPIDRHVRKVGEDFQRADGGWASVAPVPMSMIAPVDSESGLSNLELIHLLVAGGWLIDAVASAGQVVDKGEPWAKLIARFFIHLNPAKVPGNVGVSGPGWARWLWGLDARYAKLSTVADTMFGFRHALTNVGILSALALIPASVEQIKVNAQQYALDPLGMLAANVIDLEFIAATSIIGAAGGAKIGSVAGGVIGGAIGSLIPVAGTAAGASVGAFIGGLVGGAVGAWAAGKTQDAFFSSDFHDDLIADISQKGNQAVDALQAKGRELVDHAGEKIDALPGYLTSKAQELTHFTDSTVDEVTGFLNSRANQWGNFVNEKAGELLNGNEPALAL